MRSLPDLALPKGVPRDRLVYAAGAYMILWLAFWYSAKLLDVLGGASLWFLPVGLRFFSFVLLGWPALALELTVVLVANLLQFVTSGHTVPGLLSAQMGWLIYDWCALPITYSTVLLPLRRKIGGQLDLARPTHSLLFVSAALVASALGAIAGTLHLVLAGIIPQEEGVYAFGSWLIGDFIGIVTLAPLLLVRGWPSVKHFLKTGRWDGANTSNVSWTVRSRPDLHTTFGAMLALLLVFGISRYTNSTRQEPLVALLLLLPLVAAALRYGLSGAVLMVLLLDSGLVLSVSLLQQQSMGLQYQLVMIAIALVGLWLGGAVESRNRLMTAHTEELRTEVARQTLALIQANQELREKRAEAERANLEKSRFLASASHDLRQPAHALGMFIDRLDQLTYDAQSKGLVVSAKAAVREMQDMLDDMFDLSRLDIKSTQTQIQSFPLNTLFDALRSGLANEATAKGLRFRVRPSEVWLRSDSTLLRRILLNLVNNSIRYTSSGSILVACRPTHGGTHARIEVWDSGIGIAPEDQEKVFQEFYQVANPQRNRKLGLGVGLSIVERCCRLLELPLSLQSVLGGGTRVTVTVPLTDAKPQVPDEDILRSSVPSILSGCKVMVIEDDEMGREALAGLLASWGYSVIAVEGAKMAADRLKKDQLPDIIISDLRLGDGINGIEAVRMLRSLADQKIPACVISGDTDGQVRQQVEAAGLILLSKPVRPAKLRSVLRHLTQVHPEESAKQQV
jgi:signal transduction histidine kinase/ActR/RegA family two-component response regulator